jgi:hypothetical protein
MTEKELKQYLQTHYPKETTSCEWKEFKSLKYFVKIHEGDDIGLCNTVLSSYDYRDVL